MKFTKMHGCGNDYIYFDCTKSDFPGGAEGEKHDAASPDTRPQSALQPLQAHAGLVHRRLRRPGRRQGPRPAVAPPNARVAALWFQLFGNPCRPKP